MSRLRFSSIRSGDAIPLRRNPAWTLKEIAALGLLLIIALAMRVISLDDIPTNLTADETDNLQVVFRIQEIGEPGFFGLDWKPAPAFSMYLAREFMRIFGDTPFGLRMASATLSVIALLPFHAIARRVVSIPAALAAGMMLASSRWYLHFSRSGWENAQTCLFALLAVWMLIVALERGERRWFIGAGVACALGLYGYFAGRFILPALLVYAPLALWWSHRRSPVIALSGRTGSVPLRTLPASIAGARPRNVMIGFVLVTVTAIGLYIPQLRTIQKDWDYFNRRVEAVSIFSQDRPYLGEENLAGILAEQTKRTFYGFFALDGSLFNNGRYGPPGKPVLDPVTGLLFLAGLALSLLRIRSTALWWSLMLVPLIGTQVFTARTPDAARAIIVAPFMYLFVSLTIHCIS